MGTNQNVVEHGREHQQRDCGEANRAPGRHPAGQPGDQGDERDAAEEGEVEQPVGGHEGISSTWRLLRMLSQPYAFIVR